MTNSKQNSTKSTVKRTKGGIGVKIHFVGGRKRPGRAKYGDITF